MGFLQVRKSGRLKNQAQWRYLSRIVLVAIGILFFIICGPNAWADPQNRVQKMDLAELTRLIKEGDCNCLMVFLAAWCAPCKEELPILERLNRRYSAHNVQIIGISVDAGGPGTIQKVITRSGVTFSVFWVGEKAVDKFKLVGIPIIFIVKNGRIRERIPGKRSLEFIDEKIQQYLR